MEGPRITAILLSVLYLNVSEVNTNFGRYFYKRNVHRFVLKLNNGQPDVEYDYKYGTKINIINPERTGYTFTGWNEDIAGTMPDRDCLLYTSRCV